MPRPDLAGAVLIKATAARSDKRRGPQRHLRDLAFLLSLVPDPFVLADELGAANRRRVREVAPLADAGNDAWGQLAPAARSDGMGAYTVVTGAEVVCGSAGPGAPLEGCQGRRRRRPPGLDDHSNSTTLPYGPTGMPVKGGDTHEESNLTAEEKAQIRAEHLRAVVSRMRADVRARYEKGQIKLHSIKGMNDLRAQPVQLPRKPVARALPR